MKLKKCLWLLAAIYLLTPLSSQADSHQQQQGPNSSQDSSDNAATQPTETGPVRRSVMVLAVHPTLRDRVANLRKAMASKLEYAPSGELTEEDVLRLLVVDGLLNFEKTLGVVVAEQSGVSPSLELPQPQPYLEVVSLNVDGPLEKAQVKKVFLDASDSLILCMEQDIRSEPNPIELLILTRRDSKVESAQFVNDVDSAMGDCIRFIVSSLSFSDVDLKNPSVIRVSFVVNRGNPESLLQLNGFRWDLLESDTPRATKRTSFQQPQTQTSLVRMKNPPYNKAREQTVSSTVVHQSATWHAGFNLGSGVSYSPAGSTPSQLSETTLAGGGLIPTVFHLEINAFRSMGSDFSLGPYFRYQPFPWQKLPHDSFGPQSVSSCFGTTLPGACLLGIKGAKSWVASFGGESYLTIGTGLGRTMSSVSVNINDWHPACDEPSNLTGFCSINDSIRSGWWHAGVGGGLNYPLMPNLHFKVDTYLTLHLPDNALNLDFSLGLFTFL